MGTERLAGTGVSRAVRQAGGRGRSKQWHSTSSSQQRTCRWPGNCRQERNPGPQNAAPR